MMNDQDLQAVQDLIAETANQITIEMEKALISGHEEGLNFAELAEKYTNEALVDILSQMDTITLLIYRKLFLVTHEHIQKNSEPIVVAFAMMGQQTGDDDAIGKFLGSFVLPASERMLEKLKKDYSKALETSALWS